MQHWNYTKCVLEADRRPKVSLVKRELHVRYTLFCGQPKKYKLHMQMLQHILHPINCFDGSAASPECCRHTLYVLISSSCAHSITHASKCALPSVLQIAIPAQVHNLPSGSLGTYNVCKGWTAPVAILAYMDPEITLFALFAA